MLPYVLGIARTDPARDVACNTLRYILTHILAQPIIADVLAGQDNSIIWLQAINISTFLPPEDTNERLHFHVAEGASGLSVIFDLPSQHGIDPDHPRAKGEAGLQGVAVHTLRDMIAMTAGLPLDRITMALNQSVSLCGAATLAQYIAAAEAVGVSPRSLRGIIQNDSLHIRFCGYDISVPVDLSMKMSVDVIEHCVHHMPHWNPINVNMHDLRETGISAPQEIAFGLAMAIDYLEHSLRRGLDIDQVAPRMAFYCSAHIDFFEEIAKLRAARRMWTKITRDRFRARDPASWRFRFGLHTAGSSLVPQDPLNNAIRVAFEAMAGILGGAQSLHCCSYDEPICLPSEPANHLAIRTQQILAYETRVANVADPLGGSYYIESLTNQIEDEAAKVVDEIDGMGGAVAAIRTGWFERESEKAALKYQQDIETRDNLLVGVNCFESAPEDPPGGVHRVDPKTEEVMIRRIRELRASRDNGRLRKAVEDLRRHAEMGESENLMPWIKEAFKADATRAEVIGTIRLAYGLPYDAFGLAESPFFKD